MSSGMTEEQRERLAELKKQLAQAPSSEGMAEHPTVAYLKQELGYIVEGNDGGDELVHIICLAYAIAIQDVQLFLSTGESAAKTLSPNVRFKGATSIGAALQPEKTDK